MAVIFVSMILKAGNRIIGSKETTARGSPSFVQSVTIKAISPKSEAWVKLKKFIEIKNIIIALANAKAIFFK